MEGGSTEKWFKIAVQNFCVFKACWIGMVLNFLQSDLKLKQCWKYKENSYQIQLNVYYLQLPVKDMLFLWLLVVTDIFFYQNPSLKSNRTGWLAL